MYLDILTILIDHQSQITMSFDESETIYQQVLELYKAHDEIGILDLLDEVDPRSLDLGNIRILHMVHLYMTLKHTIKEYTFHDLLLELKTRDSRTRIIYDLWIEKITGSILTGGFQCKEIQDKIHKIDDLFFTLYLDSMYANIYDNAKDFDKYLTEMKRIYSTTWNHDTDFDQISKLKKSIYRIAIQHMDNKDILKIPEHESVLGHEEKSSSSSPQDLELNTNSELEFEKSKIVTMIRKIHEAMNNQKYDEATNSMSDFKNMYRSRSSDYFNSFLSRIQFEIKPSFKHALDYYHSENELSGLKDIQEISQCIEYQKIKILYSFASKLRRNKEYTDLDSLNQLINKSIESVVDFYQVDINISKKITDLTIEAQKNNIFDEYCDYLISLLESSPSLIKVHSLGDVIIAWNKNMMDNYKKTIDFYYKHQTYFHFYIRKYPSFINICIVREIVRCLCAAKFFNTMNDIDQLLGSFGLTIESFRQKQDNPVYGLIYKIYQSIPCTMIYFISQGYHINLVLDIHASKDINESKHIENICTICHEVMDPRIRSGLQCMECFEYIGHLRCLQSNKDTLTAKPCCGTSFTKSKTSLGATKNQSPVLCLKMQ